MLCSYCNKLYNCVIINMHFFLEAAILMKNKLFACMFVQAIELNEIMPEITT